MGMIPVTDEMVAAARRQIPERWGLSHLRDAITAALEVAAHSQELTFDGSAFLTDKQTAAGERLTLRMSREKLEAAFLWMDDPCVTEQGLEGPGVRDATGSPATIPVNHPQPHPALAAPLVLGGITEIADRLEVARSTVAGWIKRAEKIGMPSPIAHLAAGPVFDLVAVEAWYRAWKAGDSGGETDT